MGVVMIKKNVFNYIYQTIQLSTKQHLNGNSVGSAIDNSSFHKCCQWYNKNLGMLCVNKGKYASWFASNKDWIKLSEKQKEKKFEN